MKKVLIISSSPRKNGNSELLCKQFQKGAEESGHSCELLCLREKSIGHCVACDACRKNGGTCAIQDDMTEILEKFAAADTIVLATPVYFFSMSGQLKTMIDRMRPQYRNLKDKEIYLIATVSVDEAERLESTFEALRGFTRLLPNSVEKGLIYGNSAWLPGDVMQTPAYEQAYEMGKHC